MDILPLFLVVFILSNLSIATDQFEEEEEQEEQIEQLQSWVSKTYSEIVKKHHEAQTLNIFPASNMSVFEMIASADNVKLMVKQSAHQTDDFLRPYHYRRFALPNGSYRLHCRVMHNWVNSSDSDWILKYREVTNVIANQLDPSSTDDATSQQALVCYFVDAVDQTEANCLLSYMRSHSDKFPLLETKERTDEREPKRSRKAEPTSSLSGRYCGVLDGGPDLLTDGSHTWTLLKVLLILSIVLICISLLTKCATLLWSKCFPSPTENLYSKIEVAYHRFEN